MKNRALIIFLLCGFYGFSQVGIGTTDPKAKLDIRASNQTTPTNTDGLLIPKLDEFPLTDPAIDQDGMMVFVTGDGTPTKGFYYWDNASTSWLILSGSGAVEKIDDLLDGKSDTNGYSLFLGVGAGVADDGTDNDNVGIGFEALSSNITGETNTATGFRAMYLNVSGSGNTANGYGALRNNTADGNTAVGYLSLYSNTSGIFNTAVGVSTLRDNVDGINNSAFGINTLRFNTSGSNNTAFGESSMYQNTTGNYNTAYGKQSLYNNTVGKNNVANGATALFSNTTGEANTAIGYRSLFSNITGTSNVAIGYTSLQKNNAIGNTALGTAAGLNATGVGNVFLGYSAGADELGDNKLYIQNDNAGANNALIYGEFDNKLLRINGEFQIGDPTLTGYALPVADGAADQVLSTDGNGQLTFVTGSSVEKINDLSDGKSDADGASVFLGIDAGAADDGTDNYNVGIGFEALSSNITGETNTATGFRALYLNSSGSSNTANGYGALRNNTADNNTAVGSLSLFSNTNGTFNTAVGVSTLQENIGGRNNSAFGINTLMNNTQGSGNTALGEDSMNQNTVGGSNTAIGKQSLYNNIFGSNNIAVGLFALFKNGASRNTAVGNSAGSNTYGSDNVFLGYNAGQNASGDNKLYIENTNANSANALIYGEFDNDYLRINGTLDVATNTLYVDKNSQKVGIGTASPATQLQIVGGTDASLSNGSGFMVIGVENGLNLVIDNNEILARNNGDTSPLYLQNSGGDVYVGGSLVHTSDRRLKKDITELPYGLKEILKLKPKAYNWKKHDQKFKSLGLIAQEVQPIIKEVVHTRDDANKTLGISYTELIPVLINAIKEQEAKIKNLEQKLSKTDALEARLDHLENLLTTHNSNKDKLVLSK